jgi:predicted secreted protein
MFNDRRGKRVLLVAHCILNQNAKIDRCAHYPGAMREAAECLVASGVGIVQMPCPELLCLGLDRQADPKAPATVESEDTRVAARMREPEAVSCCDGIAEQVAHQVREYRRHGFEVTGILGINGSPTCGVETNWTGDREAPGPGVFIEALQDALRRDGAELPMCGIKASRPVESVAALEQLLGR